MKNLMKVAVGAFLIVGVSGCAAGVGVDTYANDYSASVVVTDY